MPATEKRRADVGSSLKVLLYGFESMGKNLLASLFASDLTEGESFSGHINIDFNI